MNLLSKVLIIFTVVFAILIVTNSVSASGTKVKIQTSNAPIAKGSAITFAIRVQHDKNTKCHHVRFIKLKVDGKNVKKWVYKRKSLPSGSDFIVTYSIPVEKDVVVKVKSRCNHFGRKGRDKVKITTI